MPNKHTSTATIQNAGGSGAFVEIPFDNNWDVEKRQ